MKSRHRIHWILGIFSLFVVYILISGMGEILIPRPIYALLGRGGGSDEVIDFVINGLIGLGLYLTYRLVSGEAAEPFLGPGRRWDLLRGMVVGSGLLGLIAWFFYLRGDLIFQGFEPSRTLFYHLLFFLSVSWAEEMLTRGVLQHQFPPRIRLVGILLTSLLFGLLHLANPGHTGLSIVNTTLVGIYLALMTHRTNSLRFALGFHFTWNFSLALLGMTISGFDFGRLLVETELKATMLSGLDYGIEGGSLVTIVFVGLIIYQITHYRLKEAEHEKV